MKKSGGGRGGCGCFGAPMRALSRACDTACDLYVRGMYGCARGLPRRSSAAGIVGRGFVGSSGAASLQRHRGSSDKADDLVRTAAASSRRQRRVAAEPATAEAVGYYGAGKKAVAPTMGTIAEDTPCEFGPDGAWAVSSMKSPRRGAFGVVKVGSDDAFAR